MSAGAVLLGQARHQAPGRDAAIIGAAGAGSLDPCLVDLGKAASEDAKWARA